VRSIYGGEKEYFLDVRIRFEDGHEATFNGRVRIAEVE